MSASVTVIVSFFNGERYIAKAIQSLKEQIFTQFQVLLVDDGSNDSSYKVATEEITGDQRFHILECEHQGVSSARNSALKKVETEFFTFMDVDDILAPNHLGQLVQTAVKTNADMVVCGLKYLDENKKIIFQSKLSNIKLSVADAILDSFSRLGMEGIVCNKLFKTNISRLNNVLFDPKYRRFEDHKFLVEYLLACKGYIYTISNNSYYYLKHKNSAISVISNSLEKDFLPYSEILKLCTEDERIPIAKIRSEIVNTKVSIAINHLRNENKVIEKNYALDYLKKNLTLKNVCSAHEIRKRLIFMYFLLKIRI